MSMSLMVGSFFNEVGSDEVGFRGADPWKLIGFRLLNLMVGCVRSCMTAFVNLNGFGGSNDGVSNDGVSNDDVSNDVQKGDTTVDQFGGRSDESKFRVSNGGGEFCEACGGDRVRC